MRHTKEQMIILAKKIIEDVEWSYEEGSISPSFVNLGEQYEN